MEKEVSLGVSKVAEINQHRKPFHPRARVRDPRIQQLVEKLFGDNSFISAPASAQVNNEGKEVRK